MTETFKFTIKSINDETLYIAKVDAKYKEASRSVILGRAVRAAYLRGADLTGANLTGADLTGAGLWGAGLRDANLTVAYLLGVNLRGAYLQGADLRSADLRDANLTGAYLRGVNLTGADLRDADLRGAYLRGAGLWDANLTGASLRGADLRGAYLRGARGASLAQARTSILPDGDLIGWKKAGGVLVKLRIPADAKRSNATGRKCRAEYAEVLETIGEAVGITTKYGPTTEYKVGETVRANKWDENSWNECSHGIHFFITRKEAEAFRS